MAEAFHRRGHHIQGAHGRRIALADEGTHLDGAMIALMPTAADAKRLAFPGGEKATDLHCTLFFLGEDGGAWSEEAKDALTSAVRNLVMGMPPVKAKIFGVAHWNGDGDKPSWVWSVGDMPSDNPADSTLGEARMIAGTALTMTMDLPEIPEQHSPWVAHVCAAYSGDLTVVRALEKRLGPVTFDRIRLSFGDDDRDVPLEGKAVSLTASAARRDPLEHEAFTDFSTHGKQWDDAVALASARLTGELEKWRSQIRGQIAAGADTPEDLDLLSVDTSDAAGVLAGVMYTLARQAGDSLSREAKWQGVDVGDWKLPDDMEPDAVTAAVGGQRLLRSVAKLKISEIAATVVQAAKRSVASLLARTGSPEALADAVDERLKDAQDAAVRGPVGTAMSTAQTAGREAVLRAAPPGEYYASEILDRNTCGPCKEVDGEQFDSLEIAVKAYPVMGYKDCVGPRYGNACRGMIVARWRPAQESVTAAGTEVFHGSLGDPGYHELHPGNRGKGKRKLPEPRGGMIGSPDFTEDEHTEALESYIDTPDVNLWLRKGRGTKVRDEQELKAEARVLNDFIDIQEPLTEPVTVYRGGNKLPDMDVGDEFTDRGFVSTSEDESVAQLFQMAPMMRGQGMGDMLNITMPAGTHVLEVYKVYPHGSESEFILPPGTRFRVTGVNDNGYDVEVVL